VTKFLSGSSEAERRLDRFELIAEIASGGMATVYLARLSGAGGFQRFVAIKRLHPHLANDEEFVQMFLDEARLAARLHHPNVVPILEIGESPQGYYLVMEYVEGDTLARILARSAQAGRMLPPKVSMRVCVDTIQGLHVAHEMKDDDEKPLGIVHRDVSPQNILIGMDGSARITDFGVARATTRLSTTRTGQLKGKLAYMAPEQARGADVDRRADIFAMGIVIWECLAQKRLFKGEGEADTLNRVLYEPIPSCRTANPDVPVALEAVVMRALDRDRDKRFPTASDLGDALEKAARDASWLGNHKDVASHLESVLGTDISAQRDAVRSWLSRSEPSQRFEGMIVHPVPVPSQPSFPKDTDTKVAEAAPGGVSSVSSAIIQVPGSLPSEGQPIPLMELPPRKRSRAWMVGAALGVLLVGGGVIAVASTHKTSPVAATPPQPTVTATQPAATVTAVVAIQSATTSAATSDAPSTPSATHAAVVANHNGGAKPGGHPAVKPTSTATSATVTTVATSTATSAATVDDISKNPYR
jgi:serine/threonine-protein kinase